MASAALPQLLGAPDDPLLDGLVALCRALERPTPPEALVAGLPLEAGRLAVELLPRAAERAGLSARLVRRQLDAIPDATLPCLLLLRDGRTCVLVERRPGGAAAVVLPDIGHGLIETKLAELQDGYAGVALFARPAFRPDATAPDVPGSAQAWFVSALRAQWPVYGQVALAACLINLFALASPLFVMNVYDRVVPNQAFETLWVLAAGVATVFGFDFVLRTLRGYFVDSAGKAADLRIAARLFDQVLGIRMASRPPSAGAFASNLRDYETLREFFTSATLTALVDLPFVLLFLSFVWLIGGPLALIPGVAVPIVLLAGLAIQVPLGHAVRASFRESAARHGLLVETINGLETIKSVGAEARMQRAFEDFVAKTAETGARVRGLSALAVNLATLASALVTAGVVVYGVYLIADGRLTVGALIACTILTGRAMAPLGQIAGLLARLNQSRAALASLDKLMRLPVERPPGTRFLHRPRIEGALALRRVGFTYPGQKLPALSDVSFTIAPGERVGLIGRTGSGKTTVEKLVLGLYEPDEGAVLLDSIDLRQIDPAQLRRAVGCVPQDVMLFAGTLRDNIALGAAFADDATILRAARLAGVEEFAGRHPLGLDLQVGERGEALSGGQRQQVALARALLLDPPILLLDEPTSAMDNGAEGRLKVRLTEILPGKTLLLVTHRASLLTLVDRLIVLDGGRVVADGAREETLRALAAGQIRAET